MTNFTRRPLIAAVAATALTLTASGCAAGSLGTSGGGQDAAGTVSIHLPRRQRRQHDEQREGDDRGLHRRQP